MGTRIRFEKRFSKVRLVGFPTPPTPPSFPTFCLVSTSYGKLSKEEVEAARRSVRRRLKKRGTLVLRVFPTSPFTKKPLQVRMGKGKGRIAGYRSLLAPGKVIMELSDVPVQKGVEALKAAAIKLSVPVVVRPFSELYG